MHITPPLRLLWIVCLALLTSVADAQTTQPTTRPRRVQLPPKTLYVAPAGDDANAGTQDKPFATIQHGVNQVGPGDTLLIAGGTYRERVQLTRGGFYLGRAITIAALPGEKVILDAADLPPTGYGIFDTNGNDYLHISGIHVKNSSNCGIAVARSWQVKLENCSSSNTGMSGIIIDKSGMVEVLNSEVTEACRRGGEESISVKRSQDVTVADSYIHHTGHEGIDVKEGSKNVRILRNRLHDVERQALYAEAWDSPTSDIRFEDNTVYNCMFGISLGSECGGELSDIWVVNNIVYNCRGPGIGLQDWGNRRYKHPMRDIHIINNTVANNGVPGGWGGGIVFENAEATNVNVVNNVVSGNTLGQLYTVGGKSPVSASIRSNLLDGVTEQIGENNITAKAEFIDAAGGDFNLRPDSPGFGVGFPYTPPFSAAAEQLSLGAWRRSGEAQQRK